MSTECPGTFPGAQGLEIPRGRISASAAVCGARNLRFRQRQLSPARIRSRASALSFVFNDDRQGLPQRGVAYRIGVVVGHRSWYHRWFGSSGLPCTSQPRMPLGVSSFPCCSTMRVLRLWHDVQQDNTWSSGGYGSPPLLIGIMWSIATATVNRPSFKQYSQSGFCCSFIRR